MGHSYAGGECKTLYSLWQVGSVCIDWNLYLPYNPEITLLGIHHGEIEINSHKDLYIIAAIPISQNGNKYRCPYQWLNNWLSKWLTSPLWNTTQK